MSFVMRKVRLIVLLLIVLPVVASAEMACPLAGKWKSNEKLTLEQMELNHDLNERQIKLLSNDFFGKLLIEYSCTEGTSCYEGDCETEPYTIVSQDGNEVTIESTFGRKEIALNGNCYSILIEYLGFSEIFCRVKE